MKNNLNPVLFIILNECFISRFATKVVFISNRVKETWLKREIVNKALCIGNIFLLYSPFFFYWPHKNKIHSPDSFQVYSVQYCQPHVHCCATSPQPSQSLLHMTETLFLKPALGSHLLFPRVDYLGTSWTRAVFIFL